MILISHHTPRGIALASKDGGGTVRDLGTGDLAALMAGGLPPAGAELEETQLKLAPCVPSPGKIICVGLNYRRHAAEAGMAVPETPVLFSKFNNSLAASGEDIPLPAIAEQYDYEAELAVVIGKRAQNVAQGQALDHVFGYCNANDLSARELQARTSQWLLGKSLDHFLPIGPYLVSKEEIPDVTRLGIRCFLNGEKRQDSTIADLIFGVEELVSYMSRHLTLEPGDIISTGTPEGVILGRAEKVWLKPGDQVVVEVDGLGRLSNRMVSSA
ncbi:MAG: fumarylacetoacetate hydrolase family protein [Candidatus Dormibacteraeota bacterium]|uniref:Fumarylacetoacetate hydrolase family protein n=1 Tax=Candidatus Dormiibacter inghamiae TaxID=3127013 RepID=A0A934NDS6_9BACT|nr:fumarylacetoacetate hydrolase family protein [Candidatus Dormibacteraeota bacterium]MBJ7607682.1 fumarylacetoacetate hydrolase family protein [Candidatus Dormibacteraeota bacterium]